MHKSKNTYDYSIFESNGIKYDNYNILFLTRLWDSSGITPQGILQTYPYFTESEARHEAEKWKYSLDIATEHRLEYIKELRNHFGDKIIAGVSDDEFSRRVCPQFVVDNSITNRNSYIDLIKKNFICITSEGLHHSIGWKFAEYVAAGKAIISEPLFYEVPYGFAEDKNYLTYNDVDSCINQCEYLLADISRIHNMEANNREYYLKHLRPDMLILDTLKIALPDYFK